MGSVHKKNYLKPLESEFWAPPEYISMPIAKARDRVILQATSQNKKLKGT